MSWIISWIVQETKDRCLRREKTIVGFFELAFVLVRSITLLKPI